MTQSPAPAAETYAPTILERQGSRRELGEILFVHGMLEDERTWQALADALDAQCAVQPHFPWSAKFGSHWGAEKEGPEWIAEFAGEHGRVPRIMICHSYGCNAVLEYLLRMDESAWPEVLVLICPFYRSSRADITWDTLMGLAGGLERLISESIAAQDPRNRYTGWLLDDMVKRVRDRLGVYGWAEFLKIFLRSPDLPLHRLRGATMRTMIVSGVGDHYSSHESNALLAAAIPGAMHLRIEDGGHFVQTTHSEALAREIADFSLSTLTLAVNP